MRAKDRLRSLNAIKFSVVGYHSFLLGFSLSLIMFSFLFVFFLSSFIMACLKAFSWSHYLVIVDSRISVYSYTQTQ